MRHDADDGARILVVDDDRSVATVLSALLQQAGYRTELSCSGGDALRTLEHVAVDLVLSDLRMPGLDGMALLDAVRTRWPDVGVVLLTAHGSVPAAVAAMKNGASDFLTKPFDRDEVLSTVERTLATTRRVRELPPRAAATFVDGLIGDSPLMHALQQLVTKAAHSRATTLILGESGTGKELLARAIHARSERAREPFVVVDCGAIPENLMESELFGYSRGAFTGAQRSKPGRVELAEGGTLFLDEVGELPPTLQVKLLRLLQEREYHPLGASAPQRADVRFVAATNRDLSAMVRAGSFREDLYYRLSVVSIGVPPLRARGADIEALARHFVEHFARDNGRPPLTLERDAVVALQSHEWPGNVRELQNLVESLVVLAEGPRLDAAAVHTALERRFGSSPSTRPPSHTGHELTASTLDGAKVAAERSAVLLALERAQGNRAQAARLLGVSRRTLYNKLAEFGLS